MLVVRSNDLNRVPKIAITPADKKKSTIGATKSSQKKGRKANEDLDELWNELEANTMDLVDDEVHEEEEVFTATKKKRKRVINDDDFSIADPSTPTNVIRRPGRPRKAVPVITLPSAQPNAPEVTMTLPGPISTQVGQYPVSDDPNKEIPPFTDEEDQMIKDSIEKWGTNWDLITDLVNHYKARANVGPGPAVIRLRRHVFERWRDTILPTTTPNNNNINNSNIKKKRYNKSLLWIRLTT